MDFEIIFSGLVIADTPHITTPSDIKILGQNGG
jgi:hypothetical protein